MAQTSTSPIEATGVADPASYAISYLLTLLLEAADERLATMLRYLVAATLAVRFPDDADSIHFRIRSRTERSLGEQVDVLFNDAVFYVAAQPGNLEILPKWCQMQMPGTSSTCLCPVNMKRHSGKLLPMREAALTSE